MEKEEFGTADGRKIWLYTLGNANGMKVKITNFGGIVTELHVPDREGNLADVVLGFDSLEKYKGEHPYFGAIIGRYANRIAGGEFTLNGNTYTLAKNNGKNHLHGGINGFDKKVWDVLEVTAEGETGIMLKYTSMEGEEGYPGILWATVTYTLTGLNELKIEYQAESSLPTPVNLTHHSYFNLKGAGNGSILGHVLMIDADRYTPVNEELIPTGELRDVASTPFDFREFKEIGREIAQVEGGYDHNFVLNDPGSFRKVAEAKEPGTGRFMEVWTTEPGLQFYSGNFLDGSITGKNGKAYHQHYGFCLETQHFPDSPNQPEFPDVILEPGEKYHQLTVYRFGTYELR